MSIAIESFVLNGISEEFLKVIKIISVFGQKTTEVLVVTKIDQCYGFGQNEYGVLGLGHNNQVKEPTIIEGLCSEKIINFSYGFNFVIALTLDGKLFSWGKNDWGQLGNGAKNDRFNKPAFIESLSNEFISSISCGSHHSLALTDEGEVYAWGQNRLGQIGNVSDSKTQLEPIKIFIVNMQRIIAISCGSLHSIALTENGDVYSWGNNQFGQLGFTMCANESNFPEQLKIFEKDEKISITKVCCGPYYSLILSNNGDIYAFGSNEYGQLGIDSAENQFIPKKIIIGKKFIDIAAHRIYDISVALSKEGVYYVWGYCGGEKIICPLETYYRSINTVFFIFKNITYRVIDNDFGPDNDFLFENKEDGEYVRNYDEFHIISYGSSGIVSKAKNKFENEVCAIKRISINGKFTDYILRELRIMSQLKSEFVVKINCAWAEANYLIGECHRKYKELNIPKTHPLFDEGTETLLHIKMELCEKTLREVIDWMTKKFDINHSVIISPLRYYIASEFLVEILECVDYLHKHNPPIIHRDIKPSNILITNGENGRFVKLADFGLATTHESETKSHTKDLGTPRYIAPEVYNSAHYDTKADMYSLGIVVQDLFGIDLNR